MGQAFDWSVGDTFVYKAEKTIIEIIPTGGGTSTTNTYRSNETPGFVVESRTDLSDSIIYGYRYFDDTVVTNFLVPNKNQPLTSVTTVDLELGYCSYYGIGSNFLSFADPELNHLITDTSSWAIQNAYQSCAFTERVGLKNWHYFTPTGNGSYNCLLKLVYYKSASNGFIYSDIAEQTPAASFILYPNPATDELTITTETNEPVDVSVYDMLGKQLRSIPNSAANSIQVKVSDLSAGYYLLKLTSNRGISSTKGFIIAR